ncbi:tyrosine phosphatase type IVA 1 [Paramuricea clavata]|uniref:Protein tyrosine phosphatase type IVA 3 n=1 Tax=Paramuricea clavata TaxID=317549 RepID=A0A6S7GU16_PARCT|nr:tyrosine phosphatase type IVA 1 [Paramuricea clavata]
MKTPSETKVGGILPATRRSTPSVPAVIEYKKMRFMIMDRPTNANLKTYIEELKRRDVHDVVRVCEPTYNVEPLKKEGISVLDWAFEDGAAPPKTVVEDWLELIKVRFHDKTGSCIAVHCVAGLGRAPVLVAIALIEAGMKFEDAVDLIRRQRRGAINATQLSYLEKYKPTRRLKVKEPNGCCVQ